MPPDAMDPLLIVLAVVAIVAIGTLVGWGLLRLRYARQVRALGWAFTAHPDDSIIWGLNCPPFGLGAGREVADQVSGSTPGGVAFSACLYDSDAGRRAFVGALRLARPLPEAQLSRPGSERPGIVGVRVQAGGWSAVAADAAWASEAVRALAGPLDALAALIEDVSVSLDGHSLVVLPLPREPDQLAAALAAADPLVRAADALSAPAPFVPPELSVYRHPDWVYRPRDDAALETVAVAGGRVRSRGLRRRLRRQRHPGADRAHPPVEDPREPDGPRREGWDAHRVLRQRSQRGRGTAPARVPVRRTGDQLRAREPCPVRERGLQPRLHRPRPRRAVRL